MWRSAICWQTERYFSDISQTQRQASCVHCRRISEILWLHKKCLCCCECEEPGQMSQDRVLGSLVTSYFIKLGHAANSPVVRREVSVQAGRKDSQLLLSVNTASKNTGSINRSSLHRAEWHGHRLTAHWNDGERCTVCRHVPYSALMYFRTCSSVATAASSGTRVTQQTPFLGTSIIRTEIPTSES